VYGTLQHGFGTEREIPAGLALRLRNTRPCTCGLAGVPLLDEELLLKTGMHLFQLEVFEDAARYLEETVKLLNRHGGGDRGQRMLETAHYYLALAYGHLGLDDMQRTEIDELGRLVENSGHHELLRFAEFFRISESAIEAGAPEHEIAQSLDAARRLIEATQNSENREWQRTGQQIGPVLEIIEPLLEMEDDAEIIGEYLLQQADAQAEVPGIGTFLSLAAPFFEQLKHGREDEAIRALGGMTQQFLDTYPVTRLQEAKGLMVSAWSLIGDRPSEAAARCRKAIEVFESYVEDMRVDEAIAGLIDDEGHRLYRFAVEILARVSPAEAFFYAERGRAWTLRRLLGSPGRNGPQSSSREQEVLAERSTREHDQGAESAPEEVALEPESLRQEYKRLRLRNKLMPGNEAALRPVEPVTLDQLQGEVLPPDSTLLAYFPGWRKPGLPQLWVWAVERNGIEMTSIPMPEEAWQEVACQVQALRWQGSPPGARRAAMDRGGRLIIGCDDEEDPSVALYRRLISPIARHLRQPHLIIVPHGLLHHLPFAALRNGETGPYLVQDFTLSLAPSASALKLLSQRAALTVGEEGKALVFGDPVTELKPLAGARQEAKEVAELAGSAPFLHQLATESRVYQHAARIRLLHLAAHGQYLPRSPLFSRVLLTADSENDGALEMHEVWDRLKLPGAELVVLSGCQTALGEITRGDEIIGLTHAFLVAGSRAVISTLWPVDDDASARLMVAFYDRFLKRGATAAEALRGAQLELLEQPRSAAPYYWAGFTLTGDPRTRWHQIFGTETGPQLDPYATPTPVAAIPSRTAQRQDHGNHTSSRGLWEPGALQDRRGTDPQPEPAPRPPAAVVSPKPPDGSWPAPPASPEPTLPAVALTPAPLASPESPPAPRKPDDAFVQAMSEGLEALVREDYAAAREAFERANRLRPGSPHSADGLARAEAGLRLATIVELRERALAHETREEWWDAADRYSAVLEIDATVEFARTGLAHSRERAELSDRLEFHIAHPERLSSEEVLREASMTLTRASEIVPAGIRLRGQIEKLGGLVELYSTSIPVILESDELTEVVIYQVGRLGTFDRLALDLRPGTYTVVGTRRGYRDVRRQLVVVPGEVPETLVIRCEEEF